MVGGQVIRFKGCQVFIRQPPAQKNCLEFRLIKGTASRANG
jgi:hypothetical protein